MNLKLVRNIAIILGSTVGAVYLLFLLAPFIVSPILNNYVPQINEEIKKSTGLVSTIENIKLVTTPKLTMGAKLGKFIISTPENKEILNADDFQVKMSLLPLLAKRIEIDLVKLNNVTVNLGLNKDGSFEIEKYLPAEEDTKKEDVKESVEPAELPFGLRLSNRLPDIRLGSYNVNFIDLSNGKKYSISGNKTDITDFVINKGVKISSSGNMVLDGREQFKYNLKLNNKIMPETELQDMVFNPAEEDKKDKKDDVKINLLDIFKGLYDYKVTANVDTDLTLNKDSQNGYLNLSNLSVTPNGLQIPPSNANLLFKGDKIDINSNIYTAQNEISTVNGFVKTGKSTNIDLNVKSQAELANIVRIVNAIAMTFNIKDLQTLSANGKINADFNIKSNLKTVNSSGYLKIPSAVVRYGLYNITVDKINADVDLNNNNVNIKNLGFSILEQPLRLYGTIKQDASSDLHLVSNNLSLKGLIIACGQAAILKENQVNSGLVSLKADIVGKLDKIKPTAKVNLTGLNIKNIPSDITLKLPNTDVNIITDGQTFSGTAISTNVKAVNPALTVNIPKVTANILPDVIEITQAPVNVEKINFNVSGKIKNYMNEKVTLDFITNGDIKSKLTGDMNMVKQTLNLAYATTQDSTIVVPMFDKSKMVFNTNLSITGSMMNPQLSGIFNSTSTNIPEIPVTLENISAKLHGDIANGTATVAKFVNGGIVADTISTGFSLKGENLYLNNLKGNAFEGKFNGNIVYNLSNAKTKVDFTGEGMNAEKAVAGAAGIKKALSGTLGFKANLKLTVYPQYNDMMRSLKGNLSFNIANGAFGEIGRLEKFLQANNIIGNYILKTTVASFSNIAAIKNSAQFDYISGEMTFSDGNANLTNIKSTGKTLAYFVTGTYNLINNTANLSILGRLDGTVVKLLGPLGELSAEKILSYIPKLGELTAKYSSELTADPDRERTKDLPKLSNKSEIFKDFKVVFNGPIEKAGSIKSFKWLTKVDTSAIEQQTIKETIKSLKTNLNNDADSTVKSIKDTVENIKAQREAQKEQFKESTEQLKQSVDEIKNLFKF